ncbi:hypothetical protein [Bifidobacterium biavatii]|uniref:Uncharacterized protein n=1 Tax=Bifidobacterium biavatii DSM 23969 TaxID=1437608 RepID=A0A086ZD93_9BIFI|nr:hypothetical protein [Bifidobacterium biavatii]KFI44493.1 hypothetical protein BBIA_2401 [Bifidobacterium biavatii DSM 23969]
MTIEMPIAPDMSTMIAGSFSKLTLGDLVDGLHLRFLRLRGGDPVPAWSQDGVHGLIARIDFSLADEHDPMSGSVDFSPWFNEAPAGYRQFLGVTAVKGRDLLISEGGLEHQRDLDLSTEVLVVCEPLEPNDFRVPPDVLVDIDLTGAASNTHDFILVKADYDRYRQSLAGAAVVLSSFAYGALL